MSRRILLALVFVALGVAVDRLVLAQQTGITRKVLFTLDEPGSQTHEAIMAVADLPPGATSGRHRHAGVEIGYVLEGSARLEHDGRAAIVLKPGDAFKNDGVHNVTNTSGAPAKILAVYMVEKGKPLAEPVVAAQAADLPPPFPRPGTTLLLDNAAVAVWNVSWLKQQYPLHTHRYDLIGISYAEGDRIITQGDRPGRRVTTKAWIFQTNRAGVTHVEEGASDPPMRAVLIEVKSPAPRAAATEPVDALRQVAGAPAWENNRAVAWVVMGGSTGPAHRHVGDAVELIFDGSTPKATFVAAGTAHAGPAPGEGGRAYIFEIK